LRRTKTGEEERDLQSVIRATTGDPMFTLQKPGGKRFPDEKGGAFGRTF